jgi:hypothetical protein
MEQIKKLLNSSKSKLSNNTDSLIKINLNGKGKLLPINDINHIVDIGERFNQERQTCTTYRILGTISPLISNVLFNTSGTSSWEYLNNQLFVPDSGTTYADSIKNNLKEVDGWFGFYNPIKSASTLCTFFDMEPIRNRFSFIPYENKKNWEVTITYPYSADTGHTMINNGLILISTTAVIIGGRNMIGIGTPVKHNLTAGSRVSLTGTTSDGEYTVQRIGLDDGTLTENIFCIDIPDLNIGQDSRMIRIVNGQSSSYYFRKFKKIKTVFSPEVETDDYEIFNLAFSENIYADIINQFVFNDDIDVSDLTDNLGRPLSELYLTIVKTSGDVFTNISSGIEAPMISNLNTSDINAYLLGIPVIQKIHNVPTSLSPSHIPLDTNVLISDTDFYGDVVEYNGYEVMETILGDVNHRFTTVNRESMGSIIASGPREEGYYYKAHQLIKIRDFSSYIEQGDLNTVGIPDYAENLGDGRYLWRDLMDIGINDNKDVVINYPFLNGSHYLHDNYIINVKRQDQFDFWNLYHSSFPADPIGNTMNSKFKINISNNVC